MSDARLDLLTTRCCSPMNTWATVRGFLVVTLERERIEGQIAVLEELQDADHGTDLSMCDDSAGWYSDLVSEWIGAKIAALRKELSE